jgi:hypothetical protein
MFLGGDNKDEDTISVCEDISVDDEAESAVNVENCLRANTASIGENSTSREQKELLVMSKEHNNVKTCANNLGENYDPEPMLRDPCNIDTPSISPLRLSPLLNQETDAKNKFTGIKNISRDSSSPVNIDYKQQRPSSILNKRRSHRRLFTAESEQRGNLEDDGCDFDSIPKRRSQRLQTVKDNFFADCRLPTPVDRHKRPVKVLVYDTPEEHYGMSVRRRRLRECDLRDIK